MTLAVSNGQVEGQINRLKMLKRQMYGRAGFDLLQKGCYWPVEQLPADPGINPIQDYQKQERASTVSSLSLGFTKRLEEPHVSVISYSQAVNFRE